MLCVRYVVLLVSLVAFVLSLVSTLTLPLYKNKITSYDQDGAISMSLWEVKVSETKLDTGVNVTNAGASKPVRINYAECSSFKACLRCMQAMAIAGTIFGFYTLLISILQCFFRLKVKCTLFVFYFLGFVSEIILLIVGGIVFTTSFCTNLESDGNTTAVVLKSAGYGIGPGYIVAIISTVIYIVGLVLVPFTQQLW